MKFIHMADMHLGALPDAGRPWSEAREKELWDTFSDICDACNRERADLLLIAGDMFDRQPLKKELQQVEYHLSRLDRTQVVWMAGDADYLREKDAYSSYTWPEHVHFFLGEKPQRLYFPFLDAEVWGMSYAHSHITKPIYDDISPDSGDTYRILLAHGGDDDHIPIRRHLLAAAGFDYIALGHLHTSKIWEHEKCAYAGSPEPLSPTEEGDHGYILGEITPEGTSLKLIPIARRSYKRMELTIHLNSTTYSLLEQLRQNLAAQGSSNIFTLTLKGSAIAGDDIDKDALMAAGNILEIVDKTHRELNIEEILREHRGDLIENYIERMRAYQDQGEVTKKALEYGVLALLGGLK